jgi:predicted anti-sigma-YlaC factor YlaD
VERSNLTVRMHPRRFTRLSNAFSKLPRLIAAVELYMVWYDSRGVRQTLRATLAMEAKVTDHIWSVRDLSTAWRSDR